ncbi:MAG: alpha-ribazole phosphatase [Bacteroidetes bacterium]|jgi:alpha-ribazole phosphatase|nr:alpha-ribazole phosphatase [Bacteroidota bacterium]
MSVYLIRHTKVNCPAGICYGSTDLDVTADFGHEMKRINQKLNAVVFDEVYSSPLYRCRKLADALFNNQDIKFDERLKEMDFGQWELKSWDDICQTPEGKYWMDHYINTACPGGESFWELHQRVSSFYHELKKHDNQNTAIVTHNGVIRVFKSLLMQVDIGDVFTMKGLEYGGVACFQGNWEDL